MSRAGINLENVRVKNRQAILKLLNNEGPLSRKDIAGYVKLTSASVTQLCSEMMEEGIIKELGEVLESGKVGRKKILIDIDYDFKVACCITIEKYMTYITLSNLKGDCIEEVSFKTDMTVAPEVFINEILDGCEVLFKKHHLQYHDILGIGVSLRGFVNRQEGYSDDPGDAWNEQVPVRDIIKRRLPLNVVIENNIKAFAQREIIYGSGKANKNILFIKWFPGVGAAIVIDGKVYEGKDSKVADIAHLFDGDETKRCHCGRYGCLETKISILAMEEEVLKIFSAEKTPLLYEKTQGHQDKIISVIEQYLEDEEQNLDHDVVTIILDRARIISKAIVNTITILSPDKVILYGKFVERNNIFETILNTCHQYDPSYEADYILKSEINQHSHYMGSLAIIVDELFFATGAHVN